MDKKIETLLNDQMNYEIYSAVIYLSMASYCDSVNLNGFAHWNKLQYLEEMYHASKFYNYILERGGKPVISGMDNPPSSWNSLIELFQNALNHEKSVTKRINSIMDQVIESGDHATRIFLNWFVSEQVEEESSVDGIIKKLKMTNNSDNALFIIDREMNERLYVKPANLNI